MDYGERNGGFCSICPLTSRKCVTVIFKQAKKNGQIHETEKGRSLYMKVCYTAGPVKKLENCFSVSTNAVEIRTS